MLIRRAQLEAIGRGDVTVAYRRWPRPRVRSGTTLRTSIGIVRVTGLEEVDAQRITDADAHAAGLASREELLAFLARKQGGHVYRIGLEYGGPDPRIDLREQAELTHAERADLARRLARMDQSGGGRGWPEAYLRLIASSPGVRAAILAERLGLETQAFKRRVRKLKELGLTESLRPGYRLSPRGVALLGGMSGD